jgi:hypothetical protein
MFGHDETTNQQQTQADQTTYTPAFDVTSQGVPTVTPQVTPDPVDTSSASVTPTVVAADTTPSSPTVADDDLLNIKQQALQQLSPLVGHLEQTPEEKFRTTMMMIQAADDQTLIKNAYEAAQQITDEKTRAQALLDVVNEINYFTQQNAS